MSEHSINDLKLAFAEVRHAYRLIASYQQRCFDTIKLISDLFEDRTFYQWTNAIADHTPNRAANPFDRSVWDFYPTYIGSFLYKSAGENSWSPRPGEWLLEISLITDDAAPKSLANDAYPDPTKLPDPLHSSSVMRLIIWKCIKSFDGKATWLHDVWTYNAWADENELEAGEAIERAEGKIRLFQIDIPLEELASREQIVGRIQAAKETFSKKLGITF